MSKLIEAVKEGQEVLITDRGTPVARLIGAGRRSVKKLTSHAAFGAEMPNLDPPLSETLKAVRDDRL